ILAWGITTTKVNKTLHAEVNMLQSYYKYNKATAAAGLPAGCRIYTTLQCCKMCAGMIVSCNKKQGGVHVYYGMTDPTQNASTTALGRAKAETRLSGGKGGDLRGIKTAQADDPGKALDTDYKEAKKQAKGKLDAASYGKQVDVADVTAALKAKYKSNMEPREGKEVNPYVRAALEQVRMFLNHVGTMHNVTGFIP